MALVETSLDEVPGTHVLRFFLEPDEVAGLGIATKRNLECVGRPRVELLDADDRDRGIFAAVAGSDHVVADLAGRQHDLGDVGGPQVVDVGIVEQFLERAAGQLADRRLRRPSPQQRLRGDDEERLANLTMHLTTQQVEVLRGRRGVADLDVVLGAGQQHTLDTGRRVLGALALVAVGEQEHEAAVLLPLVLGADDELVDHDLGAVDEVAELGFPHDECVGVGQGVAVLETEGGVFAQH